MHYRFINTDNHKTAVFNDNVNDGVNYIWGARFEEYQVLKSLERLMEVDHLPLRRSPFNDVICIEVNDDLVTRMLDNFIAGGYSSRRGSLYSVIKKLRARKLKSKQTS